MRTKTLSCLVLLLAVLGCASAKTAPLPNDPVAHFPEMKEGDRYQVSITGMEKAQWEVVSVQENGGFVIRQTVEGSRSSRLLKVNSDYLISGEANDQLSNMKLSFPLFPESNGAMFLRERARTA